MLSRGLSVAGRVADIQELTIWESSPSITDFQLESAHQPLNNDAAASRSRTLLAHSSSIASLTACFCAVTNDWPSSFSRSGSSRIFRMRSAMPASCLAAKGSKCSDAGARSSIAESTNVVILRSWMHSSKGLGDPLYDAQYS